VPLHPTLHDNVQPTNPASFSLFHTNIRDHTSDMSLADHQTSAPSLASLPGLPYELSVAVIEQCDMSSLIALSETSRQFQRLADPYDKSRRSLMEEFLIEAQTFPRWQQDQQDGFACFSCTNVLPRNSFGKPHTKGPRGRNGGCQYQRFCIQCGMDKGLFVPGSIVKQGGVTRLKCRQCKLLKGGRFCDLCKFCTDCVRRYGIKPCEGEVLHRMIGDEVPRTETPQAVTASKITSHSSLSLAGLYMSDYEATTGESASAEWYDDPDDI
jgi:hypothetical protein